MNKKGFTLIELLIVIAIIGLLSTMSVLAVNSAREKSRNARRVADVRQIQAALELYFTNSNSYPAAVSAGGSIGSSTDDSGIVMAKVPSNVSPVTDGFCPGPSTENNYTYQVDTAGYDTYVIQWCISQKTGDIEKIGTQNQVYHATPAGLSNGTGVGGATITFPTN